MCGIVGFVHAQAGAGGAAGGAGQDRQVWELLIVAATLGLMSVSWSS